MSQKDLEFLELLTTLKNNGHSRIIELILDDPEATTRNGRINKSAICRILDIKPAMFELELEKIQELLCNQTGLLPMDYSRGKFKKTRGTKWTYADSLGVDDSIEAEYFE